MSDDREDLPDELSGFLNYHKNHSQIEFPVTYQLCDHGWTPIDTDKAVQEESVLICVHPWSNFLKYIGI